MSFKYACLFVVCVAAAGAAVAAEERPKPNDGKPVGVAELMKTVKLIGRLGVPIGDPCTIKGKWTVNTSKPGDELLLAVHEVNGKSLREPVYFEAESVFSILSSVTKQEPKKDEQWRMRVVETGEFRGYSDAVWKELGMGKPAEPRGFVTRIVYLNASPAPAKNAPNGD